MNITQLNRDELLGLLESIRSRDEAEEQRVRTSLAEKDRLLSNLELHQIELEVQNRELREAQRDLEESRNRYADLYDFAPVGYCSLDLDCVIRELNLTGASLLGCSRDELVGVPFLTAVHAADTNALARHFARCATAHDPVSDELKIFVRGQTREMQIISSRVFDWEGHSSGYRCVLHDISVRKAAEEERRRLLRWESRERSRLSLLDAAAHELFEAHDVESMVDALAFVARLAVPSLADFCVIYLADREELRGSCAVHRDEKEERELASRVRAVRLPLDDLTVSICRVVRDLRTTRFHASELPGVFEDSSGLGHPEWDESEVLVVPLRGRQHTLGVVCFGVSPGCALHEEHALALAKELATRCAFALENAMLVEDLQRAVQSRDALLAIVSHDLRSPLNAISLSARSMGTPHPDRERRGSKRHVDLILRSVQRMDQLIEDLLAAGNLETGQLGVCAELESLPHIVSDVCQLFGPSAQQKTLTLEHEVPEGLMVTVDRRRLVQVLSNLLGNAIKFSPHGATVRVAAQRQGTHVKVSVSDAGPGIPAHQRSRVFDRYWTGSPSKGGLGLGLYIARRLVEAQGGKLWLDNEDEPGCTFSFTLPGRT
jgi:PAS domain S-box-containing protein